jgi:hypothetical protein
MDDSYNNLASWFTKLRAEWFQKMRPLGAWVPWELRDLVQIEETNEERSLWDKGLLRRAPQLSEDHLRNCIVLPDRTTILERLPKGGVVAEVGTDQGDFARQILRIVSSRIASDLCIRDGSIPGCCCWRAHAVRSAAASAPAGSSIDRRRRARAPGGWHAAPADRPCVPAPARHRTAEPIRAASPRSAAPRDLWR